MTYSKKQSIPLISSAFIKECDKKKVDTALIELQMKLFITISGAEKEYGWNGTIFTTTERFWDGTDVFERADKIFPEEAEEALRERLFRLNPNAKERKVRKFYIWISSCGNKSET